MKKVKGIMISNEELNPVKIVLKGEFIDYYLNMNGKILHSDKREAIENNEICVLDMNGELSIQAFNLVFDWFSFLREYNQTEFENLKNNTLNNELIKNIISVESTIGTYCSYEEIYSFFELVSYYGNEILKHIGCFGKIVIDFNREEFEYNSIDNNVMVSIMTIEDYLEMIKDSFNNSDSGKHIHSKTFADLIKDGYINPLDMKSTFEEISDDDIIFDENTFKEDLYQFVRTNDFEDDLSIFDLEFKE